MLVYLVPLTRINVVLLCTQVEQSFLQNEGGIGMAQSTKKDGEHGVILQLRHTNQHDTIPISLSNRTSLLEQRYRDSVMLICVSPH